MSTPTLHITIAAGASFSQIYTIKESDGSPMNLSGKTIFARMAKHAGAIIADKSTNTDPVFNFIEFGINILNSNLGECAITLPKETTVKLPEGKMVYSIFLQNESEETFEVVQGLAFIKSTLGFSAGYGSISNSYGV